MKTRDDATLELVPLAPADWDYLLLEDIRYRNKDVTILWDKTGERYGRGKGLQIYVDDRLVLTAPSLGPVKVDNAFAKQTETESTNSATVEKTLVNFAVNNDGTYYPRLTSSYASGDSPLMKVIDRNYWYLQHPPKSMDGGRDRPNQSDWIEVDFGTPRRS